jgi:hypothetical protein
MTVRIADVRRANGMWFSSKNQRLFNDVEYRVLHTKDGNPYVVRLTGMFSDMFDGHLKYVYKINPILEPSLTVGIMVDRDFNTLDEVKEWLKNTP